MTTAYDYGPGSYPYPRPASAFDSSFSTGTVPLDGAGENCFLVGRCYIVGRASKTISAGGGGSIGFLLGTTTFADAGTTLEIGIQDVSLTSGTPARGDGTMDVHASLTGSGGGITQSVWNTITMTSGTKTIGNGDYIAIAFQMPSRAGADVVRFAMAQTMGSFILNEPQVTFEAAATFTAQAMLPNAVITFDDGTLGAIYGSLIHSVLSSSVSYDSSSSPDELCNIVKFPRPTPIEGFWANMQYVDAGGTFEVILYSSPLGTPAAVAGGTLTIDTDTRVAAVNNRFGYFYLPTPILLTADTDYAVAFRPTGAENISLPYTTVQAASHWDLMPGGQQCYYATRSDQSGAFSGTSTRRLIAGLIVCGGDDGAGGGGGGAINPLNGMIV